MKAANPPSRKAAGESAVSPQPWPADQKILRRSPTVAATGVDAGGKIGNHPDRHPRFARARLRGAGAFCRYELQKTVVIDLAPMLACKFGNCGA